jgi:sialate O-acetylesterase
MYLVGIQKGEKITLQIGAIIETGPRNWQIFQQKDGYANISMSGIYKEPENIDEKWDIGIFARIVSENTGDVIVPWKKSDYMRDGKWKITLKEVPAGGLYRIETCIAHSGNGWRTEWAIRGDIIHHIGVGDLYIIAGQSNAKGYGREPVNDPPELGIHLFKGNGNWDLAVHPFGDSTGIIHETSMDESPPGHCPYLNFAKLLKSKLGYPIGLIQTSKGGSSLSEWNPNEKGNLYHAMLDMVRRSGEGVKGVLWYQGCSDAAEELCESYYERFEQVVMSIRKELKDEKLPFLTCQLNRCTAAATEEIDKAWGKIRESQRQAALRISQIYIVPTIDCGISDGIHNNSASNMMIGERIAKVALKELYGFSYNCQAPNIKTAYAVDENKIILEFQNVYGNLDNRVLGVSALPFMVESHKDKVKIKEYCIYGNKIELILDEKLEGDYYVHGAYEKNPKIFVPFDDSTHLPMLAFYGVKVEMKYDVLPHR